MSNAGNSWAQKIFRVPFAQTHILVVRKWRKYFVHCKDHKHWCKSSCGPLHMTLYKFFWHKLAQTFQRHPSTFSRTLSETSFYHKGTMFKSRNTDQSVVDLISETMNLISSFSKGDWLPTWMQLYYLGSGSQLSYASEQ